MRTYVRPWIFTKVFSVISVRQTIGTDWFKVDRNIPCTAQHYRNTGLRFLLQLVDDISACFCLHNRRSIKSREKLKKTRVPSWMHTFSSCFSYTVLLVRHLSMKDPNFRMHPLDNFYLLTCHHSCTVMLRLQMQWLSWRAGWPAPHRLRKAEQM